MSIDEFIAWEREQPERYEFAHGVAVMMTGGSAAHVTIAMNLAFALRHALRGSGCRPFGSDMKVIANGTVRYPDVSVSCAPVNDKDDRLISPVVIVEILSPSTEHVDRGRKKFDYFATPSIRQYAIVEQDERRVDLYTRAGTGWTNEVVTGDMVLNLSSVGVVLGSVLK
ncbi:MAG TPA: Uma2 family endonuclease [Stellaceae bacterium]|nr:Uma2 family endonuclease [Stellaceae bacterium]